MSSSKTITLISDLSNLSAVESLAEEFAHEANFDVDTASQITMAAREAAINAIIHGNEQDQTKQVIAAAYINENALTILISDQGAGFDPLDIKDPLLSENILRTSGRGVLLMRTFMDEVHFRRLDRGTEISLVKYRFQKET